MISSENEFLAFLDSNGFMYQRIEHPAVFTCAEDYIAQRCLQ